MGCRLLLFWTDDWPAVGHLGKMEQNHKAIQGHCPPVRFPDTHNRFYRWLLWSMRKQKETAYSRRSGGGGVRSSVYGCQTRAPSPWLILFLKAIIPNIYESTMKL